MRVGDRRGGRGTGGGGVRNTKGKRRGGGGGGGGGFRPIRGKEEGLLGEEVQRQRETTTV